MMISPVIPARRMMKRPISLTQTSVLLASLLYYAFMLKFNGACRARPTHLHLAALFSPEGKGRALGNF